MVTAFTGFDVLCHAMESYTAIPFDSRPAASDPKFRPAYQGSNPISDIWSLHALRMCKEYFYRAVANPDDIEARGAMHLVWVISVKNIFSELEKLIFKNLS